MKSKEREKSLVKNTLILSIGTLGSKIFTFFLLPLYTNVLSTEDYGTVDVLQSMINLLIPVITLQLGSAVFRHIISQEEKELQGKVISSAYIMVLINIVVGCLIIIGVNRFYEIPYFKYFIVCLIVTTVSSVLLDTVRGFGHNATYSVASFLAVVVSLVTNLVLIIGFRFKGSSILIAMTASNFVTVIFICYKEKIWKLIHKSYISIKEVVELCKYSLGLVPNAISWWVANTSDRLVIAGYLGNSSNGIYAAANKIPAIYTTLYMVYILAWTESVSRAINDKDRNAFINRMLIKSYKLFGSICLVIITGTSIFFNMLIGADYAGAYNQIYILMVAIYISSLCALYGAIYTGFIRSKIIGVTTGIGAIVNVIINVSLINTIGLYAASISTLISYIVIMLARIRGLRNLIKLNWPIGYFLRFGVLAIIVSIGYFIRDARLNIGVAFLLLVWSYFENKSDIKKIWGIS